MTIEERARRVALRATIEFVRREKGEAAAAAIRDQLVVSYSLISSTKAGGRTPH